MGFEPVHTACTYRDSSIRRSLVTLGMSDVKEVSRSAVESCETAPEHVPTFKVAYASLGNPYVIAH